MKKNKSYMFPNFIKGKTYFLKFFEENKPFYGLSNFDTHTIEIFKNLNDFEAKKVIFHELLHTYFFESGLISFSTNELLIEFLESIYFDINQNVEEIFKLLKKVQKNG